jgi:integrase
LEKARQHSERNWLLILVLARSGRRINEVLPLKPKDILWKEKLITWHILKKGYHKVGSKAYRRAQRLGKPNEPYIRLKPIDARTLRALQSYILGNRIGYDDKLFPISSTQAYRIIRGYAESIGIDKVGERYPHPHNFRHTFAIKIAKTLKSPQDLVQLQRLMEHSDINMTIHYLTYGDEELRQVLARAFDIKDFDTFEKKVKIEVPIIDAGFVPPETLLVPIISNKEEKPKASKPKVEILVPIIENEEAENS